MKKLFVLPITFGILLTSFAAHAQDHQESKGEEQIIIIRKMPGQSPRIDTISSSAFNIRGFNPGNFMRYFRRFRDGINLDSLKLSSTPKTFLGVMTKDNDKGAEVVDVTKGSPAEKAGIEKGDIITKVDKADVKSASNLSGIISNLKSGDKVRIELLRNKKKKNIPVTLGERNEDFGLNLKGLNLRDFTYPQSRNFYNLFNTRPSLGLQIQDTEEGNGVKVLKVEKGSAAEKAGVQPGDLITAFNGNKVSDVTGVLKEKNSIKSGENYNLSIIRNQKPMTITVQVPKVLKKATL